MEGERRCETSEEEDLRDQSIKKVKGGDHSFSHESSMPMSYADIGEKPHEDGTKAKSNQDSVLGQKPTTAPGGG